MLVGSILIWIFHGSVDLAVIQWSHDFHPSWYRPLSAFITKFGDPTGWLVGSLIIWLLAQFKYHNRFAAHKARFFFSAVAITGLSVLPLKWIFGKARPSKLFEDNLYGFDWFVSPTAYGMHSFPSGHTTTAFTVATALTLIFPRFAVAFYLGALLVGLSRIGVLYHYPSDVVAGAMLGSVLTLLLYKCDKISFKNSTQA